MNDGVRRLFYAQLFTTVQVEVLARELLLARVVVLLYSSE